MEKFKQRLHKFAQKIGLGLEIEGPMSRTDFLDISLNLESETYSPFRKENNEIKYIKTESNHPNTILKKIPTMIAKRITKRSINKEEFDKVANEYNQALRRSGYKENIEYEKEQTEEKKT